MGFLSRLSGRNTEAQQVGRSSGAGLDGGGKMRGGGMLSTLPPGFPFPVPNGTTLSFDSDGIYLQSGGVAQRWPWEMVARIETADVGSMKGVMVTLADNTSINLAVQGGRDREVAKMRHLLSTWEARLEPDELPRREAMKASVADAEAASKRRRAEAKRLPGNQQTPARGHLTSLRTGETLGGGPIFLADSFMALHDRDGQREVARLPYDLIGCFEATEKGSPHRVAEVVDSDEAYQLFVSTEDIAKWLKDFSQYAAHNGVTIDMEGNVSSSPLAGLSAEDLALRGVAAMESGLIDGPHGAESLFLRAAAAGSAAAMCNLGFLRRQQGNESPDDGALYWYQRAADAGNPLAEFNIGNARMQAGLIDGADGAIHWYSRAAASGHAYAMFNLGWITHQTGDISGAMAWYRKAADLDNADAMFNAGSIQGSRGVIDGPDGAMDWYGRAAALGHTKARSALARLRAT